jgi:hypothetical protein
MDEFRKTIKGIDFAFILDEVECEFYYRIECENHRFELRINEEGVWKICGNAPSWICELEDDLGIAIHEHDA